MPQQMDASWSDELVCIPSWSVTRDNVQRLDERMSRLDERRICELSVTARAAAREAVALLQNGMRIDEVLALMTGVIEMPHTILHDDALDAHIARLRQHADLRRTEDEAVFCELFCRALLACGVRLHESALLPTSPKAASVAYVKNLYADEAFDVFSQDMPRMKPVMVRSFTEAAECMRRGEVGYCLFPLEEGGGRLSSVQALLYQNDLKIVAVTPVFGYDGTAELTYALLSTSFDPIEYDSSDDLYLEIALPREDTASLCTVLQTAQSFGIGVYRTDTVQYMAGEDRRAVHTLVLRDHRNSLFAFLCYLWLFVADFVPIGLYKNVE